VGSRADDKLKEIEQIRASLGGKLEEIERRFPLAGMGKKVGAALAGSSVAASALGFGLRRMRGKKRKAKASKRSKDQPAFAPPVVTVNVLPKGAAWVAAAGFAAWAGVKVYESIKRKNGDAPEFRPAVVKRLPEAEAGRGAGN
jgi:hypothetical protein